MSMNTDKVIKRARKFAKPFCITKGQQFRMKDVDPGDTLAFKSEAKPRVKEALAIGVQALAEFQEKLYAQNKWAVLLIFQAMDAAGKDGSPTAESRRNYLEVSQQIRIGLRGTGSVPQKPPGSSTGLSS